MRDQVGASFFEHLQILFGVGLIQICTRLNGGTAPVHLEGTHGGHNDDRVGL